MNTIVANLDNGNTALLLAAIGPVGNNFKSSNTSGTTMSEGQLKNLLIANSPLSDAVIIALINSTNPLSPGLFKNVMDVNMPVSDNAWPHFKNYIATLPPGIANQLLNLQTSATTGTPALVDRQLRAALNEQNQTFTQLITQYYATDTLEPIIALFEQESTSEANIRLAGTYIDQNNIGAALSKINSLPSLNPEQLALSNLLTIYLSTVQSGGTLFDLDSVKMEQVRTIATMCPTNQGSLLASSLIKIRYNQDVATCAGAKLVGENAPIGKSIKYETSYLGNNIPNPFNSKTMIPFVLAEDVGTATIQITDLTGRIIKSVDINREMFFIDIDLSELQSGIYLYTLRIEDKPVQSKRLLLSK